MRTTVDIDSDLIAQVRKIAYDERISFKEALNRTITRGLAPAAKAATQRAQFRLPTFPLGLERHYDIRNIRQQLDEEDDLRLLELMRRREDEREDS